MRHLITLTDVTSAEIERIYAITEDLKSKFIQGVREPLLPGRMMALLFEKQSLRTRVSFESCMTHLGGGSMLLGDDAGFGKRESIADFTRVLSEMVDIIVVRSKKHATVEQVAQHSKAVVVNGLTDQAHPCQALADLFTMREHCGPLAGKKLAWVGDGNNVAISLARGCAKQGIAMSICSPPGYEVAEQVVDEIRQQTPDCDISITNSPTEAVSDADAVYTDVWASMGQESEQAQRRRDFADYQVNAELMSHAPDSAVFMHCLPAKRGEEVTDQVIDSPQSIVVPQAGNRMHVQKGIIVWLLGSQAS